MERLENRLKLKENKEFFVGNDYTIADFYLLGFAKITYWEKALSERTASIFNNYGIF